MFLHKKEAYKFSDKKHSIKGLISTAIGITAIIALMVLAYIASLSGGNGTILLGLVGIGFAVLSGVGFYLGIDACKESDIYYTAPVAGIIINGFILIIYLLLYMVGISA